MRCGSTCTPPGSGSSTPWSPVGSTRCGRSRRSPRGWRWRGSWNRHRRGPGSASGSGCTPRVPVGGCAETVWAQPHLVAPLPDSLSAAQGAALVVNDHTAHVALVRRAGIRPGESVLVHGAAGGLGSAAVRIAAALGARVTAVASTPQRRAAATAAGAHRVYGPDGMAGHGSGGRRRGRHRRPDRRRRVRRVAAGAGPGGPAAHPRLRLRPHPVGPGEPVAACATAMSEESTGAA